MVDSRDAADPSAHRADGAAPDGDARRGGTAAWVAAGLLLGLLGGVLAGLLRAPRPARPATGPDQDARAGARG